MDFPVKRAVDALRNESFDLLILGGGITGAGVALDAALRGLRVALIDKGDFAFGTSSVSSKLIHGGLRYLEHGNLPLVFEALQERSLLLGNAPHLVRPLRFVLPYHEGQRISPWQWRLGLTLYDLLSGRGNIRRSGPLSLGQLRREFPGLRAEPLRGAAQFYDAQMDDARLCLEVILTAAQQGARVANYVEAIAFEQSGGQITGVRVIDRLGGAEISIRARQVLNATGPWVDQLCRLAGDRGGPYLEPTKGVHILAPGRGLGAAFLLLHPADGRVFFVMPWLGKTLIGTTDTFTDEGPDHLKVLPEEVEYLLAGHNHYFQPPLETTEVLSGFVGLRPLIRSRSQEPSALSREFRLFASSSGLLSAAGGKYTTYRRMAEQITNVIATRLGCRRRCLTRHFPLIGTPQQPWLPFVAQTVPYLVQQHGLSRAQAAHLVNRYGRRASDVAACLVAAPELIRPIVPGEPDMQVELVYQRDCEMAASPADSFLRRTRLGLFYPDLPAAAES
jgi:glycerol-3-phosphate dehydrogenase